jgi:hypothetical protein
MATLGLGVAGVATMGISARRKNGEAGTGLLRQGRGARSCQHREGVGNPDEGLVCWVPVRR